MNLSSPLNFDEKLLKTFDEGKAQRLYRLYAKNGVAQIPTLYVLKTLWQSNKDGLKLNEQDMQSGKRIFAKDLEAVGEMKRAGVMILAGTDGPMHRAATLFTASWSFLLRRV